MHVAKEEVYLPLLDARLAPEKAVALCRDMGAAAEETKWHAVET